MIKNVNNDNIQLVLDGFQKYYQLMSQKGQFSCDEFKNFMEPIFTEAGYRDKASKVDGTNILIIHDAGVGDFITMSAAIREIRRIYPEAYITLIVKSIAFSMAECCPYVNEIIENEMSFSNANFMAMYHWNINFAKRLLKHNYDICFAFDRIAATPLLAYMSGAREIIASKSSLDPNMIYSMPQGAPHCHHFASLLTVEVPLDYSLIQRKGLGVHVVDKCLGFLEYMLRAPIANRDIEIWYNDEDLKKVKQYLKDCGTDNCYAICMGGSVAFKCWPPENYAQLLKLILSVEDSAKFIILGGVDDENAVEILKQYLDRDIFDNHVIDLTGKINYRQSATILTLCKTYIGTDTGTMHAAAAVKVPIISTFSFPADLKMTEESTPSIWYPYCVPSVVVLPHNSLPECKGSHTPYGCHIFFRPHCITQISVKTMFKAFNLLKQQIEKGAMEPLYIY